MKKKTFMVIGDIHGNIGALKEFLTYADNNDVEKIFNLGDFIQGGPNPVEVFDIVVNDRRFVNILGNEDFELISNISKDCNYTEKEHHQWNLELIGNERMAILKTIPTERIMTVENKRIFMVHSRINSMTDLPLLHKKATLDEYVKDYGQVWDYVLVGHTHCQNFVKHRSGTSIINPGTLGCCKDGFVDFAVMEFYENGTVDVSFKSLKYNIDNTILEFFKKKVPNRDNILKSVYKIG